MSYKIDNFVESYLQYRKGNEASLFMHRWSILTALGAAIGRKFYLEFGTGRIYPTMYVMIIGSPGARKSTAIKQAKGLLADAGYRTFSADRTSKEKFLLDLEGKQDDAEPSGKKSTEEILNALVLPSEDTTSDDELLAQPPKEIFIAADEFNDFIGLGNLEFLSILGSFWDYAGVYRNRIKNGRSVTIANPTVSILAGNTHSSFAECFPPQTLGQGFLSRILLVYGENTGRKVTFPPVGDPELKASLVKKLSQIVATVQGPCRLTPGARSALDTIYRTWKDLEDYRFQHYSTRRFTHLIKLCLVTCASRGSNELTETDVITANTLLTYTENLMPKALGEFGKSKNAEAAGKVMDALYRSKTALTLPDLWKLVQNDLEKISELSTLLLKLQQADKIQTVGRGFLPKQQAVSSDRTYVDFKLLRQLEGI